MGRVKRNRLRRPVSIAPHRERTSEGANESIRSRTQDRDGRRDRGRDPAPLTPRRLFLSVHYDAGRRRGAESWSVKASQFHHRCKSYPPCVGSESYGNVCVKYGTGDRQCPTVVDRTSVRSRSAGDRDATQIDGGIALDGGHATGAFRIKTEEFASRPLNPQFTKDCEFVVNEDRPAQTRRKRMTSFSLKDPPGASPHG